MRVMTPLAVTRATKDYLDVTCESSSDNNAYSIKLGYLGLEVRSRYGGACPTVLMHETALSMLSLMISQFLSNNVPEISVLILISMKVIQIW